MRVFAASLIEMWSSARRQTRLSPDEETAERLLAGQGLHLDAPASERILELVLTAAAGPATERELAREPERARRRSPRRVPVLAAAIALVAVVALCGTAEAGALPAPLQQLAHRAINAPAPAPPPAVRNLLPSGHVTPGPGGTGSHPASNGLNQQSRTPSASPNPTHTDNGQGSDNGQGQASDNGNGKAKGKATGKSSHTADPGTSNGNGQGNGNGNSQN
jgi:hypothetical protein